MSASFVLDMVIAILLIAACGYGFILNRRLKGLRENQREMIDMIGKFDKAATLARGNLEIMQTQGHSAGQDLDLVMDRARSLIDELSVMVHAGDNIAGRIEGAVGEVRAIGKRTIQ